MLHIHIREYAEVLKEEDLEMIPADGLEKHSRLSPGEEKCSVLYEMIFGTVWCTYGVMIC